MTTPVRQMTAVMLACGALAAAGCGSDDEPKGEGLPSATAAELDQRLDEIQRRYDDAVDNDNPGACDDIQSDSFKAISDTLDGLPDDVDPDVRDAVDRSFERLQQLTQEGCADVQRTDTETVPAPEPQEDTTTETTPTQTETTPPDTTPERTTPKPEKKPKKNDGNGGTPPGQGGGLPAPNIDGDG